jgi:hypothetical protein
MSGNSWLEVDLVGPEASPNGVGARVAATFDGRILVREVGHAEGGTRSNGHFRLYFGLGAADSVDLDVRWPDGRRQSLADVAPGRRMTVRHPDRLRRQGGGRQSPSPEAGSSATTRPPAGPRASR